MLQLCIITAFYMTLLNGQQKKKGRVNRFGTRNGINREEEQWSNCSKNITVFCFAWYGKEDTAKGWPALRKNNVAMILAVMLWEEIHFVSVWCRFAGCKSSDYPSSRVVYATSSFKGDVGCSGKESNIKYHLICHNDA